MPGVVAGVLLTFIPAAGDFINAQLLGTPKQFMIGNVIQSRYLVRGRLPDRRGALVPADGVHADHRDHLGAHRRHRGAARDRGRARHDRGAPAPRVSTGSSTSTRRSRWSTCCSRSRSSSSSPSTTRRAASTSSGRSSASTPGSTRSRSRACRTRSKTSLEIAAFSTLIATALGTLTALALVRYEFKGRAPVNFFIFIPLATPEVVLGAALLSQFLNWGTPAARLRDDPDRARDVQPVVRGHHGQIEADRLRQVARGGGAGSRRHAVGDVPARDAAADHARCPGRRPCSRSRCRSTTS